MKEIIVGVNQHANFFICEMVNKELKTKTKTLQVDYDFIGNYDFSGVYEEIFKLLTNKDLSSVSKNYSKIEYRLGGTSTILFEKVF